MRTSFSDTFESPITVTIDGRGEVVLPLLTTRDYLPWLDELTKAKRESDTKSIPAQARPTERFRMLQFINSSEATPEDIAPLIFSGKGAIRILDMALAKAGVKDEAERNRFIDARPHTANEELAARVSGLLSDARLVELFGFKHAAPSPVAEALRAIGLALHKSEGIGDVEYQQILDAADSIPLVPRVSRVPQPSTGGDEQEAQTFGGVPTGGAGGPNPSAAEPEAVAAA